LLPDELRPGRRSGQEGVVEAVATVAGAQGLDEARGVAAPAAQGGTGCIAGVDSHRRHGGSVRLCPVAVGVIVPVRAPAPYLGEALESVLAQDPAPDDVVVVDDGPQPPLEVPGELADRVRVVRAAAGGPAAARAAGLHATDAGLIALADADDV